MMPRPLRVINGAAGWATAAVLAAARCASHGDARGALQGLAAVPTAAVFGAVSGALWLPSYMGPVDVLRAAVRRW